MDEKVFKERAARLKEIGKVIEILPAEIRALAFPLIAGYASIGLSHDGAGHKNKLQSPQDTKDSPADREEFFGAFSHEKPADNAKLAAAWLYQEYGSDSFSTAEIKEIEKEVGITIPDRVDATFAAAKENGKNLFTRAGRGKFKPTVHGETYLKATYHITKGKKTRPTGDK